MATIAKKECRFDMRITQEQRNKIERAAAIKGKTLTQWAMDHLMESAQRDIEEETMTKLSADAFAEFTKALDAPLSSAAQKLVEMKPVWES